MAKILNKDQQRLVSENVELAERVALRFGHVILRDNHEKSITMDDIKMEAILGLCEAALRYDESSDADFSTVAFIWCKKFALRAMRKYGTPLSVPANFTEGANLAHIDTMMEDVASAYADKDDDGSPADRIFFQIAASAEVEETNKDALRERVRNAMSRLTPREQVVITRLFGLDGKEMTCKEVALMLALDPRRIRQIKEHALRKMEMS